MGYLTKDEFKILMKGLKAAYPQEKSFDEMNAKVWYIHLRDIPYKILQDAINIHIQRCRWFPSISDLREICAKMASPSDELTELSAWALVKKAVANSTYHSEEEYEKLPELVQRTVGSPENLRDWAQMDIETLSSVTQSNFIRNYRTMASREKEAHQIVPNLLEALQGGRYGQLGMDGSNEGQV